MATPATAERTVPRICPFCEAACGLLVGLDGERVVSVRGNDADVFSKGYICPKGAALKDLHHDPDRLRTPLVKRDGRFEPATWEEAFAEIDRRLPPLLAAHGRDACGLVFGNPVVHKAGLLLNTPRLARAIGTKNVFSASTVDQMPKQLSAGLMFGHWLSIPVPDVERADFALILGANPAVSNGSLWTVPDVRGKLKAMKARGGRIVVVDPRFTETAEIAGEHLAIRPGADVFLLAAMAATLFEEGLVRLGGLAPHVAGLEDLEAAVRPFAPETVAARCDVPAATIRDLARALARAEAGFVYGRIGTCTQEYGTLASWLVDALNVLAGHLDRPGGAMFPKAAAFAANTAGTPGTGRGVVTGRHRARVSGAPEVYGELPLVALAEEIETEGPGRIRALVSVAANPVLSAPGGPRLAAALETLDFMVAVDIYVSETSRHADVILPGTSPLEEPHFDVAFGQLAYRNAARWSPAALPPQDRPPEWQVLLKLAAIAEGKGAAADPVAVDDALAEAELRRLAGPMAEALLAAAKDLKGPDRQIDLALRAGPYGDRFGARPGGLSLAALKAAPDGVDLGPLAPRVPEVLRTPSGRIELAPAVLVADLARARAALDDAAPALVVVGRRDVRSNNSWMHNLPILAKGPFRCTLLVHPDDVARLGLVDGGPARLEGGGRAVEVVVEASAAMRPGVVSLPHGWGHDLPGTGQRLAAARPGANLNAVLDERRTDPLSGNAVLSGVEVRLVPVAAAVAAE